MSKIRVNTLETVDAASSVAVSDLAAASTHPAASSGAHAASAISNTPAGNIAATTVQTAINELDSAKVGKTGAQSMTGVLTTGGLLSNAGGIGYGVGAGGTVTQSTSKDTTVTLNKPNGKITMSGAELAAGAVVTFQFNNSTIGADDSLHLMLAPGGAAYSSGNYQFWGFSSAGVAFITILNRSAGALSNPLGIRFYLVKGSAS